MKFVRSSESLGWCLLSILGNAQPFSSFAASDSGSLFSPGMIPTGNPLPGSENGGCKVSVG